MEGNLRFKIDWASLIVGSTLPFLLCFTLYLRTIFQVQAPDRRVFCVYTWRGLFSEFYGMLLSFLFKKLQLKT